MTTYKVTAHSIEPEPDHNIPMFLKNGDTFKIENNRVVFYSDLLAEGSYLSEIYIATGVAYQHPFPSGTPEFLLTSPSAIVDGSECTLNFSAIGRDKGSNGEEPDSTETFIATAEPTCPPDNVDS